jgi:hypothetical protein
VTCKSEKACAVPNTNTHLLKLLPINISVSTTHIFRIKIRSHWLKGPNVIAKAAKMFMRWKRQPFLKKKPVSSRCHHTPTCRFWAVYGFSVVRTKAMVCRRRLFRNLSFQSFCWVEREDLTPNLVLKLGRALIDFCEGRESPDWSRN